MSNTPLDYLRTLAAVERAHILGDDADVEGILGSVDPADLRELITRMELSGCDEAGEPEPRAATPLRAHDALPARGSSGLGNRASGSPVYPEVFHANDNWSVRCR